MVATPLVSPHCPRVSSGCVGRRREPRLLVAASPGSGSAESRGGVRRGAARVYIGHDVSMSKVLIYFFYKLKEGLFLCF